jgi:hypothetical protein
MEAQIYDVTLHMPVITMNYNDANNVKKIETLPIPAPALLSNISHIHYSPPASAEVKKMWIYTSTPPYAFMA